MHALQDNFLYCLHHQQSHNCNIFCITCYVCSVKLCIIFSSLDSCLRYHKLRILDGLDFHNFSSFRSRKYNVDEKVRDTICPLHVKMCLNICKSKANFWVESSLYDLRSLAFSRSLEICWIGCMRSQYQPKSLEFL